MRRALALARRGRTSPNPMVGAVVVKDGSIVGEGFHKKAGEPHAEINALRAAGDLAQGSTLYVTLEPCCHSGRTPPCTDAIKRYGVAAVAAAMVDPNPMVAGKGLERLQAAGIRTSVGLLESEARRLNEVFIKYMTTGLPFVTLKLAMTLDGKIATANGDSKWISSESSRRIVHKMRENSDATLVGLGTVLADDPALTARVGKRISYPVRVIVDSRANTPVDAAVFRQKAGDTLIAVTNAAPPERRRKLEAVGGRIIEVDESDGRVSMSGLVAELGSQGVTSILIEGGGMIAGSALEAGIVDKAAFFIAPKIAGDERARTAVAGRAIDKISDAIRLEEMTVRKVDCDVLIEGYPCLRD